MTHEELVAALTAAIDDPPTDGTAGEGDEPEAENLLEQLLAAKGGVDGAAAGLAKAQETADDLHASFLAAQTLWSANRTAYFEDLDRSTRALELLLQNQVTPGVDPEVDAMDPGTPGDINSPAAVEARAKTARAVGKRHRINSSILTSLGRCVYFFTHLGPQPVVEPTENTHLVNYMRNRLSSAQVAYSAAFNAGVAFVEYLEIEP